MRIINFENPRGMGRISEEEAKIHSKKYHEETLAEVRGHKKVKAVGVGERQINFLLAGEKQEDEKVLDSAYEGISPVLDKLYELFGHDLAEARVHNSESEKEEHLVSLKDFFARLLIMVGGDRESDETGGYSPSRHVVVLHLNDYIDPSGQILIDDLYRSLTHEFVHFVSAGNLTARKNKLGGYQIKEYSSGFMSARDNQTGGENRQYEGFNEAIVDYYTFIILPQLQEEKSLSDERFLKKEIDPARSQYAKERELLDHLFDYLATYNKVSKDNVWREWRNGLLSGRVLGNANIRKTLAACFGQDFLANFLNNFEAQSIESLDKRWEQNGAKNLSST